MKTSAIAHVTSTISDKVQDELELRLAAAKINQSISRKADTIVETFSEPAAAQESAQRLLTMGVFSVVRTIPDNTNRVALYVASADADRAGKILANEKASGDQGR